MRKKYYCSLFNAFHRSQARYIQLDSWTVELNHFQCTGENSNTIPSPNEQNDYFIFIYLSKLFNLQWLWEAVFTRSICVLTHKMYTLVNFFVRYLNVKWGFNFFYGPSTLLMIPYRIFFTVQSCEQQFTSTNFSPNCQSYNCWTFYK